MYTKPTPDFCDHDDSGYHGSLWWTYDAYDMIGPHMDSLGTISQIGESWLFVWGPES